MRTMRWQSIFGEELGNDPLAPSFSSQEARPETVAAIGGNGVIAQREQGKIKTSRQSFVSSVFWILQGSSYVNV